jgi:hemoglobin-like flavoprotein
MNDFQKLLVQASFQKVVGIADVAAELFYARLFMLDPSLKPMFRGDMQEQGRKLMSAIRMTVEGLDRADEIVPLLRKLGRQHVAYGVKDEHYEVVGSALLWTLERGLGNDFTPQVAAAWAAAYGVVAGAMKEGAAEAPAPRKMNRPAGAEPPPVPRSHHVEPQSVRMS